MKMYFVDCSTNELKEYADYLNTDIVIGMGDLSYREQIKLFNEQNKDKKRILTNCFYLLSLVDFYDIWIWNDKLNLFCYIQDLTEIRIRPAHDIERIWRNGGFGE